MASFLSIPPSSISVTVKVIDVCTIYDVPADALFAPPVPGVKQLPPAPSFVFLIEHPSGQKILYDLGIRKDWQKNLAPGILARFKKVGYRPSVEKNVSEVLEEAGIGKENINAVIWSHAHWDHTGDMSTFPPTTDLVVGRGFKNYFLGDGEGAASALGGILPSDMEGRTVREISFDQGPQALRIGRFAAYDYFDDGSVYLLDSPGHCVGHVCALVRTTTNPDTFVFLAGDAAHHCAELRPSTHCPLPDSITPDPTKSPPHNNVPFCPGSWFEKLQVSRGCESNQPLYVPAFGHNMEEVLETIGKMQECDGDENVFVMLTHDAALRSRKVPRFPDAVNDWKARGLREEFRWTWIGDIVAALRGDGEGSH